MMQTTLNNGVLMPMLGYGVFQISNEETKRCVLDVISQGYRLIDTAQAYGNEEGVGQAIAACGLPREDLFITSKIWISRAGYDKAKASIEESLRKLNTSYIDLMLIHQPFSDYYGSYRAMEEAYDAGKLRAIGVSNFYPDRLIDLCEFVRIPPAVNQVETHVFHQQKAAHAYMSQYGVAHQAWAPFAEGKNDMFNNPVLLSIAQKHGKTAAQVELRFLLQEGVSVIPKTVKVERMRENMEVFDFALDEKDLNDLRALDTGESLFFSHQDPQTAMRLISYGKSK